MRGFLERRRKYVNPRTRRSSFNVLDVLPVRLTLNMRYVREKKLTGGSSRFRWKYNHRLSDEYLFNEVRLVPARPALQRRDLSRRGRSSVDKVLAQIAATVKRFWRPGQFHVVMHSSGYDSRLFSAILWRLWVEEEIGGDLLFICTKLEGRAFKEIMEFEGWEPSHYIVYRETAPDLEYFAPSLEDFAGAWHRLGGVSRIPVNLFWYAVAGLQGEGRLPAREKIDMWHTQWADSMLWSVGGSGATQFNQIWKDLYYHNNATRPFLCAAEFSPWLNRNVIREVMGLPRSAVQEGNLDAPEFKRQLCERVLPGLSRLTNVGWMGDERRNVSPRLQQIIKARYLESWYGATVAPGAGEEFNCHTDFHDFWEHWTSASLCEALTGEGYRIHAG